MEELRSTEALHREILEDARKKAFRILKSADDSVAAQDKEWDQKFRESVDSLRKTYSEKTGKSTQEVLARLPLDKRRLHSGITQDFLYRAMDDFLRRLSRDKLLAVLKNELSQRLEACFRDNLDLSVSNPVVFYSMMSIQEIRRMLEEIMTAHTGTALSASGDHDVKAEIAKWDFREDSHGHEFPFVVIDTPSVRLSVSVENAAQSLLLEKRAELAAALLGEGVLND